MDLWIRSQDRMRLTIVNNIQVCKELENEFWIRNYDFDGKSTRLGIYATKERALEVLDEIQKYLINNAFAKKTNGLGETLDIIPNPIFVYEMPDE